LEGESGPLLLELEIDEAGAVMEILHDVGNEMHNAEKLILQSKMMADGMAGMH